MLIPELGYGGAEQSFLSVAHLLTSHHDVSIVTFAEGYSKGGYTKVAPQTEIPIRLLDREGLRSGRVTRWIGRWIRLRKMKSGVDLTISFLSGANLLNVVTFSRSKTVVSMRGSRVYDPNLTRFQIFLYRYFLDPITFELAGRIVAISTGLANELRQFVRGSVRHKICTIEPSVDADALFSLSQLPVEPELEALRGKPVLAVLGRLSPEKGFQHLIPIFAEVQKRISHSKLLVIGDGPLLGPLQKICEEKDLPYSLNLNREVDVSAVIFLGHRENPIRYLRFARVFVSSSLTEGFGKVVLEALAAGVPVIATDCPWGTRFILQKGEVVPENAYPTHSPTDTTFGTLMPRIDKKPFDRVWVEVLSRALVDPVEEHSVDQAGRDRVREFDHSQVGQKWLRLVAELTTDYPVGRTAQGRQRAPRS